MKEDQRKKRELVKQREIKVDEMGKLQQDDTKGKERLQTEIESLEEEIACLAQPRRVILPTGSDRNPTRSDRNFINRRNPIEFRVAVQHPDS